MNNIVVKVKLTADAINLPVYMTEGASGFDLQAVEELTVEPNETCLVNTGLIFEIPKGYEIQIRSRSGLALKQGLIVLNSPGTIDADYRGVVKIIVKNLSNNAFAIKKGERIAQGVLCPIMQADFIKVENIEETIRSIKGFGSTGLH